MYTIYTQKNCMYCTKAKALMKEHNIDFVEISLDYDSNAKALMKELGNKTVPQIFNEENIHLGGYIDLYETIYSG
jgi:glutaredoxin